MKYTRSVQSIGRALAGLGPATRRTDRSLDLIAQRQTYALIGELARRRERTRGPHVDLRLEELKVFSQNGEDGIIAALLHAIGDSPEFFVEFGVQGGDECNTRLLAEFLAWRGVYFEPHPPSHHTLAGRYQHRSGVVVRPDAVTPSNVADLFERNAVPARFGILSIDVDGQDYWIWKALPDRFRPDIVVIEYNSSHAGDTAVVEREGLPFEDVRCATFGASIAAIEQVGAAKGYELVHCDATGVNAILVASELLKPRRLTVTGITRRDANYFLGGLGHAATPVRPTVTPPDPATTAAPRG